MCELNKIGEKYLNNDGDEFEIIEYISTRNCTVWFKDGFVSSNRQYGDINREELAYLVYPAWVILSAFVLGIYLN